MIQNPGSPAQARAAARAILSRAATEPAFLTALTSSPIETLQSAGFSIENAREFSQELTTGEVAGYRRCEFTCDVYSCYLTWCGDIPYTN